MKDNTQYPIFKNPFFRSIKIQHVTHHIKYYKKYQNLVKGLVKVKCNKVFMDSYKIILFFD